MKYFAAILLISVLCAFVEARPHQFRVGGVQKSKKATKEIKRLALSMKDEVEEQTGRTFTLFKAKQYAEQLVAGTNYFIKVKVGKGEFIHIKVYQPLSGDPMLTGQQITGIKKKSPIEYF